MLINGTLSSVFFLFSLVFSLFFAADNPLLDKKLADKYGLIIPPPNEKLEPAPEWLQKSDMFTFDWAVWKDHKFIIKDTLLTRIVRVRASYGLKEITEHYPVETIGSFDGSLIKGVSLFTQAPHCKKAFEEAHKQGVKAIPYVHFSDIHTFYADQDVFFFQHPEILLKNAGGKWLNIPMDGSSRAFRFLTCANSPSYWKLSLAYVKKMMDWEGRRQTWEDVKKRAQENEWYLNAGRRITAKSFLNLSRKEVKDDAFRAFSAARLVDFIWWAELNDSPEDQNVELVLPDGFQPKRLLDLYNGSQIIQVKNKKVKVSVPKKTARVYLLAQNL